MSLINRASRKSICLALVALAAAVVPAQAAFTPIVICDPTTAPPAGSLINLPGDYEVTADLTQPANTACILITTNNVSLKLNGHQITGNPTPINNGAGISATPIEPNFSSVDHVAIQGPGLIQGFGFGIELYLVSYVQVQSVTVANNGVGILANGTFLNIASNVAVRNPAWGMQVFTSGGTVQYNEVIGNGSDGLSLESGGLTVGGSGNTVNNNNVGGNGPTSGINPMSVAPGILISGANNRIFGNTTDGNSLAGIQLYAGSTGNEIFNNTSSVGNGKFDLEDDNPCGSNYWSDDTFFIANLACIH